MWDHRLIWMVPPSQDRNSVEDWERRATDLSQDDWELVSVVAQRGLWGVIFKRPSKR